MGKLGLRGIAAGEHFFVLTANDDGTTRLEHGDRYSGVLVVLSRGRSAKGGFDNDAETRTTMRVSASALSRGDRTRTCNPRFWRPVRYQLRHAPGLRHDCIGVSGGSLRLDHTVLRRDRGRERPCRALGDRCGRRRPSRLDGHPRLVGCEEIPLVARILIW